MITEEDRLSQWLRSSTPLPPRTVTVEQLVAHRVTEHRRPHRILLPLLAAACVAVLVAVTAVVLARAGGENAEPAGPAGNASSSPSPSATSGAGAGWGLRAVGGAAAGGRPVAAHGGSLYVVLGSDLARVDPDTGAVLAAVDAGTSSFSQAVVAGHRLWTAAPDPDQTSFVTLHSWTIDSLAPIASQRVPVTGTRVGDPSLATDGRHIFIGTGTQFAIVTIRSALVHRVHLGARIASVATQVDSGRVFVTTQRPSQHTSLLHIVDPSSGLPLRPASSIDGGVGEQGLADSPAGLWMTVGHGSSRVLEYRAGPDEAPAVELPVRAGGEDNVTSTDAGAAVWLGGTGTVACADAEKGTLLASTALPGAGTNVTGLHPIGTRLFGYRRASDGTADLVVMTPPARCAVR